MLAELEVSQSSAIPWEQKMTQGIVAVLMTCEVKTQKLGKIRGFSEYCRKACQAVHSCLCRHKQINPIPAKCSTACA